LCFVCLRPVSFVLFVFVLNINNSPVSSTNKSDRHDITEIMLKWH
jgi:hypothetical protein